MKRIALLCTLLCLAVPAMATTKAQPSTQFIMSAQHCDLLQEATAIMVEQKREGMSLDAVKFSVENAYLTGANKAPYAKVKPYIYAVTDEYYANPDLAEIDYASVIGRNCRDSIGRTAE